MSKPSVLHIMYSGPGGQSYVGLSILECAASAGYENKVLFWGIEAVASSNFEKATQFAGAQNVKSIVKKGVAHTISNVVQFIKAIKSLSPTTVICHMPSLILFLYLYKIVFKHGLNIVIVEHHSIELRGKKENLLSTCCNLMANHIVFLTQGSFQGISKYVKFTPDKVNIIPNGIPISTFAPSHTHLHKQAHEPFIVTMISRLDPKKDHITIVKAIDILKAKGYPIKCYFAGDGDTRDHLEMEVNRMNLASQVSLLGNINAQAVIDLLHSSDVYIQSSMGETLSISVLQAMASKIPVIASNVTGLNNMIEHKINGLLFTLSDENDLVLQIESLIHDKALYDCLVSNAFARVSIENSYESMFRRYELLIK